MSVIRKSLICSLAVALLLSMQASPSAAAIKPGQPCSKLKTTFKQGSKVYTCIQSGRKKVWSKGVTVLTPPSVFLDSTPVTPLTELRPINECRLQDASNNLFHLGFPVSPLLKDLENFKIFAIPVEFSDTGSDRLSESATASMFDSVKNYFESESYDRTHIKFVLPPTDAQTGRATSIRLEESGATSPFTTRSGSFDFVPLIRNVLKQVPITWNLDQYDSVLIYFQDTRTRNFVGGQAWRGSPDSPLGQMPFDFAGGKVHSLVLSSAITTVMSHELGHALFGLLDLYASDGSNSYLNGWGLMGSSYGNEMGIRAWEKWLLGWVQDSAIRCASTSSSHFLSLLHIRTERPKLLVLPLDLNRAIVVEAMQLASTMTDRNGQLYACGKVSDCRFPERRGILVSLVDVKLLSAEGAIKVPESMRYPDILTQGSSISLDRFSIKVRACDESGCVVDVESK